MPSTGQSSADPSHVSDGSQLPSDDRQRATLFASAGQEAALPLQTSAGSQIPADGRHAVPWALTASPGHVPAGLLGHFSSMSQKPASARHTNDAFWKTSLPQVALDPLHFSVGLQESSEPSLSTANFSCVSSVSTMIE